MISALQEMCAVCIFQGIYFQSHQLGTHGRLGHGNLQIFPLNVMRMQTQVQVQISIKIQIQMEIGKYSSSMLWEYKQKYKYKYK